MLQETSLEAQVVASSSWQGSLACTLLLSQQLVELVREKKTPEAVDCYVLSDVVSNFWLMFSKL